MRYNTLGDYVIAADDNDVAKKCLDITAFQFEGEPLPSNVTAPADLAMWVSDKQYRFSARFGAMFMAATHMGGATPIERWTKVWGLVDECTSIEALNPVYEVLRAAMEAFEEEMAHPEAEEGVAIAGGIVAALAGHVASRMDHLAVDEVFGE